MALMTAKEYIESLRELKTRVYMFGERIENWVDHPMIRPSINCVAMTYALAQDPRYEELMTAVSSLTGHKINRFTHLHQSSDDLVKKVKMQRLLGQKTASCFQRCVGMDAFNAVYSLSLIHIYPWSRSQEALLNFSRNRRNTYGIQRKEKGSYSNHQGKE